jgi:hypothetical protein
VLVNVETSSPIVPGKSLRRGDHGIASIVTLGTPLESE